MRTLSRAALVFAAALLFLPPANLVVRTASAAAVSAPDSKNKKKTKHRTNRNEKILKGRRGKHARKAA
jgi:hypothetical protein